MNTSDKIKAKGFKSIEEMSKVSGISVEAIKAYPYQIGGAKNKDDFHNNLKSTIEIIEAANKIKELKD